MDETNPITSQPSAPTPQVTAPSPAPQPSAPSAPQNTGVQPSQPTPVGGGSVGGGQGGFSIRDYVQRQGGDPSGFQSDEELAAAMWNLSQQSQSMQPYADIGRRFAPYADKMNDFQEFLKQKEEAQKKEQEEAAAKAKLPPFEWRKPEYDPSYEQHCRVNPQTGRYEAIHADWALEAQKLNAAVDARQANSRMLLDDFPGLLDKYSTQRETAFRQSMQAEIDKMISEKLGSYQESQAASEWVSQHLGDYFVVDQNGKAVLDANGQEQLNPKGQAFREYADSLRAGGLTDQKVICDLAGKLVSADAAQGKFGAPSAGPTAPSAPATPAQPNRFLSRFKGATGGRTQQRGGAPASEPSVPAGGDSLSDLMAIVQSVNGQS